MNFTQIKNLSQAIMIFQKAAESSPYTYMFFHETIVFSKSMSDFKPIYTHET